MKDFVKETRIKLEKAAGVHKEGTVVNFGTALYPKYDDYFNFIALVGDGCVQGYLQKCKNGKWGAMHGEDGDAFGAGNVYEEKDISKFYTDQEVITLLEDIVLSPANIEEAKGNKRGGDMANFFGAAVTYFNS